MSNLRKDICFSRASLFLTYPVAVSMCAGVVFPASALAQNRNELRAPSAFAGIADRDSRSRALFSEVAKVIMNPRCMNCHPAGNRPLQGNDKHRHIPPAVRGEAGVGGPGNQCVACHTQGNYTLLEPATTYESIPGHPRWGLAPIEM